MALRRYWNWTAASGVLILLAMAAHPSQDRCILALEDGTILIGTTFGARGTQTGEVVFNTSMCGYQEILTDPSYCRQIVTMTAPQIGNYGINREDVESSRPQVSGFVVREVSRRASNHRSTYRIQDYLAETGVIGISNVDTRALTRRLRVDGAMRGLITTEITDPAECVRRAEAAGGMSGVDLVSVVAPQESTTWTQGLNGAFVPLRNGESTQPLVVAIDCGMKRNILRHLIDLGCRVRVMPPTCNAAEILEQNPSGVFVSNGPGDPAAVSYAIELLKVLLGRVPLFGICLGHQLLGLALGATTFKMKFGHRGGNHPVQSLATGRVEITSQNHGFALDRASLEDVGGLPTHVNLNDRTLEGFGHRDMPLMAIQYHPEASPGPHDATYLFDCFATMMDTGKSPTGEDLADAQAALQHRHSTPA